MLINLLRIGHLKFKIICFALNNVMYVRITMTREAIIDKSWMTLKCGSSEYMVGIQQFIEFTKSTH